MLLAPEIVHPARRVARAPVRRRVGGPVAGIHHHHLDGAAAADAARVRVHARRHQLVAEPAPGPAVGLPAAVERALEEDLVDGAGVDARADAEGFARVGLPARLPELRLAAVAGRAHVAVVLFYGERGCVSQACEGCVCKGKCKKGLWRGKRGLMRCDDMWKRKQSKRKCQKRQKELTLLLATPSHPSGTCTLGHLPMLALAPLYGFAASPPCVLRLVESVPVLPLLPPPTTAAPSLLPPATPWASLLPPATPAASLLPPATVDPVLEPAVPVERGTPPAADEAGDGAAGT